MREPLPAVSIVGLKTKGKDSEILAWRALADWPFDGTPLAVLGHPIRHSLSPPMHNAALNSLARDDGRYADWRYFRFDVPPDELTSALSAFHRRRFRGLNLTLPHKVLAVEGLASLDEDVRAVGAVNTLRWSPEGWEGFNTDGYGLSAALRETLGRGLEGAAVILLGAGGAARSAAVECLRRRCAALWIANRSADRLAALIEVLRDPAGDIPLRGFAPAAPPDGLPRGALVINATSAGLHDDDAPPIDLAVLPPVGAVFDMIYNPPRTALLRRAAEMEIPSANGLAMLVHQGAKSLEFWSGVPAATTAPLMRAALDSV